jgi:hypothetical protein
MGLTGVNEVVMSVDAATAAFPETQAKTAEPGASAALTARAVIAVTLSGAGFWYLLWKLASYLVAGR